MTGLEAKLIENIEEVGNHLRDLEKKRIDNDILNVHKNRPLYEVYRKMNQIKEDICEKK